ncbi:response regulator [Jatrophihabitans sp.]|uniref:response regulator n=1 Tax=Jatrophihabitans sp. TaxID=1932789 RepID=UPI003916EF61
MVDDHAVFADALRERLLIEADIGPVGVAYSVADAIERLPAQQPDVALVDLLLTDGSGLEIAERAHDLAPATRIMMLTANEDPDEVVEAVLVGARAWLPKTIDPHQLVRAIRAVYVGEVWFDPMLLGAVLPALVARSNAPAPDALATLTMREREVLDCLADGMSRADTAARLQVSLNTVRSHVQNVIAKLGVHSTLEAAALRNQIRAKH